TVLKTYDTKKRTTIVPLEITGKPTAGEALLKVDNPISVAEGITITPGAVLLVFLHDRPKSSGLEG
ncbi:hypothetical protein H2198_006245, partial [Neophaeococcomyces mojaviensis]